MKEFDVEQEEVDLDPIGFLRELQAGRRELSQFSRPDWHWLLHSKQCERFVALLFVLREYLRNLDLILFFSDYFPDFEGIYGIQGFALTPGCRVLARIRATRANWLRPLEELLDRASPEIGAQLQRISELALKVESDFEEFYDLEARCSNGVGYRRFSRDEFSRQELAALFAQSIKRGCLSIMPVRNALRFTGQQQQWFFLYHDARLRREADFEPVPRSVLASAKDGAFCSPIPDAVANGHGNWIYFLFFGHLCYEARVLATQKIVVRSRAPRAAEFFFTRSSPFVVLQLFQPNEGEALLCDVRRASAIPFKSSYLNGHAALIARALAFQILVFQPRK